MILGLILKFSFLPQFILDTFNMNSSELNLNLITGGFLLSLRFILRVVVDIIVEYYNIYQDEGLLPYTNNIYDGGVMSDSGIKPNLDNTINFSEKKGDSSNTNAISLEDYSWSSDEESSGSEKEPHSNPEPQVMDENEKKSMESALQKHQLEIFEKQVLDKSSLEEVVATMNELEDKKEEYKISGSNVPAAKTQIALLEEQIRMCTERIDKEMSELDTKEAEGKGKEVEGKGKEVEGKGKEAEK
jgi:hypothetical protein